MKKLSQILLLTTIVLTIGLFSSCGNDYSSSTGWAYNNPDNGGFEVVPYAEQETGPGLVLIEGGTFVMGRTDDEIPYSWDNIPRRVTVSSFYMDQTEVRNLDYLEYLFWLTRIMALDYPNVYRDALPDTLVWRSQLGYNEPYVDNYLRHPSYRDYPVVGVNWVKANQYCMWRTDRVNEMILVREGILDMDPMQIPEENFNTEAYFAGQYEGMVRNDLVDLNPNGAGTRKVRMEDGILIPKYRLPTEAEWEFAALGLIGNTMYERVVERRVYPWNGHIQRNDDPRALGEFVANFKRGRGDNMGVAGNLNDNADITSPVYAYWPNDYGLYNMAGNVAEWVLDVYRPLSAEDFDDFRPFRGNEYKTQVRDDEGLIEEKDTLGRIQWRSVTNEECADRRNYRQSDNRSYIDGDPSSSIDPNSWANPNSKDAGAIVYDYGATSMINDRARIYKGGSWSDRSYWLSAGVKRYLDEEEATDYIGFRCCMTRVGSPVGMW